MINLKRYEYYYYCIGDYADFVVYDPYTDLNAKRITSFSVWMIPGTWRD